MQASSANSLLWLDYETFGANPRCDRPAEFAAVRTDWALNEIEAPVRWHCQPAPDYWPDPVACLVTGITPEQCQAQGLSEEAFAAHIEAILGRAGTISVGYNSMKFDDEVTRFLLWRTLREPYAREWQNGCGRWDLLPVVRMLHALRPQSLTWPKRDDGSGLTSFKLDRLSAANGIAHEHAHSALSDVRATLALARRIREVNPRLFEFALNLRNKQQVLCEMGLASKPDQADEGYTPSTQNAVLGRGWAWRGSAFLHVSGQINAAHGHLAVMFPIAAHPSNSNEIICWDLRHDPSELLELDAQTIRTRLFTRAEAMPEGTQRLPIKTIHINQSPMVIGKLAVLQAPEAERWAIDKARVNAHIHAAQQLEHARSDWAELWSAVYAPNLARRAPDVEAGLYAGGFVSNGDRRRLQQWRSLEPAARSAQPLPTFDDARLGELAWRWQARNWPEALSETERERWQQFCAQRLLDGSGSGGRGAEQFFAQLDDLAEQLSEVPPADAHEAERQEALLGALYDWGSERVPEF